MNEMTIPMRSLPNNTLYDPVALVGAVIELSPYRKVLMPLCDDIVRVAQNNRQISAALHVIAERSGFREKGRLRRADLGPQAAVVSMFLEYIRFASPDFLRSVGEWPTGGVRG